MKHILILFFTCIAFASQAQTTDTSTYVLDTVTYKKVQGAYHYFRYDKRVRPGKLHLAMDDQYYSAKTFRTHRANATINALIIVTSASLIGYQVYNMWNDLEVNKKQIYLAAGIVGIGIPINLAFDRVMFNLVKKNNRKIQKEFRNSEFPKNRISERPN